MWKLYHKEGWVPNNWCFWTVVLEKTLESPLEDSWEWVPWKSPARRSNKSILKEINPEYSLEGPVLKPQYSGHLMWTANSLEKTLILGKIEGGRKGRQRMQRMDGITNSTDMNVGKLWEMVRAREAWHGAFHGVTKSRTQLGDWTKTTTPSLTLWRTLTDTGSSIFLTAVVWRKVKNDRSWILEWWCEKSYGPLSKQNSNWWK